MTERAGVGYSYGGPDMREHVAALNDKRAKAMEMGRAERVERQHSRNKLTARERAGTAYIPGLADFVPMVKGNSNMALAGPHLVKAAVGEDVTAEEMGGSRIHCKVSGVADLEVNDDPACIQAVKSYLSFFPSSNLEAPPLVDTDDPADRRVEELYDIVPANPRSAYDTYKVIEALVDDGDFCAIKPHWARNIVTGFARFGGRPVGIVANQPKFLGGAVDVNAADKAARFVWLCDAFHIPLVFLMDTPGFLVGSAVEKQGIIRHGSKMLFAVAEATVPKFTVVMRKGYGAGYYVMNGRAYEPDVIDPADTRAVIARGLEQTVEKHTERPWRKHGVLPV